MLQFKNAFVWVFSLVLALAGCLVPPAALGQATSGTISGTVTDQSGASVLGAAVSVRNLDTNVTRTAATGADGRYNFPGLPVGRYEVIIEVKGFAKHVRGPINLVLNQEAVVNVELKPASVQETIVVTDDAPMLSTSSAEVGVRFDERRLADLPIAAFAGGGFRDVFAAVLSAPGVSQLNSGNSQFASGTAFSANGMRTRGNNFMIDGQDSNDPSVSGRTQWVNNPDIVKEVRLITNQFLAEYGRSAGSVVNAITKSGTNALHGSAFEFYNGNHLNSLSNLNKAAGNKEAPFLIEHQFGGTAGGRIIKDKTFFFGSLQRWTQRQLGSGYTIRGVPTDQGKQMLQQLAGSRPQVAALLKFMPAAQAPIGANARLTVGGQTVQVPLGSLTSSTAAFSNNYQWSGRIDHQLTDKHSLGGRFMFNNNFSGGGGQATPPGLTTQVPSRQQALSVWLTSTLSARTLNEVRLSYQRLGSTTTASDPASETIPSIEIPELGLTGFNAAADRTAIGLAVNLPQFRFNNTYQIQETFTHTRGAHSLKFGMDLRRVQVKSLFVPQIRGRLVYDTLQTLVDDVASVANVNKPLPGGELLAYYLWDDYYFFAQDTWRIGKSLTLNYGLRYETPGNSFRSLYNLNDRIVASSNNQPVFKLTPRPGRDVNNFQPRIGFSWNPRTSKDGLLGRLTGGDRLVFRGGYSRTNDYGFININLNIFSSFPFVLATGASNLQNAWTAMPNLFPDLRDPAALNLLTRTIVGGDFRAPIAEQFAFETQRELGASSVFRVGYVGTKGSALFQTIDGNPRAQCSPIPTNAAGTVTGCSRVDTAAGIVRLRANAASSVYHSLQVSFDKRFSHGFIAGAHYTWSAFIDNASEIFNPSARGEVAVSQDSFNRSADRGRSTYDRPHRFATNFVYEIPGGKLNHAAAKRVIGGWQVGAFVTLQSGSPFSPLNGSDPTLALGGIDGLVGSAIRPNLNTTLDVSSMSVEELLAAGGRSLFSTLPTCQRITGTNTCTPVQRFGNIGRNILRSDGIAQIDLSLMKATKITERHQLQFRADFFNFGNTRNFGIPEARVSNAGFANQWGTDGGNRRIFMSLKYVF
ncbi:MAG: carboxypeptidase regulatory-like domain-containing protein [Bryobacterales bacterium]|nr:carboxypeptidase regulatory-like domain-containing protein [Bryobacterales bacterium]